MYSLFVFRAKAHKLLLLKNSNIYTNLKHKIKLKYHSILADFQVIRLFPNDDDRTVGFKQIVKLGVQLSDITNIKVAVVIKVQVQSIYCKY